MIPPHTEVPEKYKARAFITAPTRAPAETQRSGFGGKKAVQRSERVFVGGSGGNERYVACAADGQHRICLVCGEAAALPNAPSGQSPAPKFRAEARTHF